MTKKLFIESIAALKRQYEYDAECNKAFMVLLPNDFVSGYDNHIINNAMLTLLGELMNDRGGWIDYFCFELDFGKKYKKGCANYKDGTVIDLSSASTLYELLISEK